MKSRIYYKPTPDFFEAVRTENVVTIYQAHGKRVAECAWAVQHRRAVAVTPHDIRIFKRLADAIGFTGTPLYHTPEVVR